MASTLAKRGLVRWRNVLRPELCAALRAEAVAMLEEVRNLARWSWHIVAEIEEFQGFCSRDFEGFSGFFRGMLMDVFIVRRCWGILPDFHGFWPTKMVVHPTTNQLTTFFPDNKPPILEVIIRPILFLVIFGMVSWVYHSIPGAYLTQWTSIENGLSLGLPHYLWS